MRVGVPVEVLVVIGPNPKGSPPVVVCTPNNTVPVPEEGVDPKKFGVWPTDVAPNVNPVETPEAGILPKEKPLDAVDAGLVIRENPAEVDGVPNSEDFPVFVDGMPNVRSEFGAVEAVVPNGVEPNIFAFAVFDGVDPKEKPDSSKKKLMWKHKISGLVIITVVF